jgi:hypothetical protein
MRTHVSIYLYVQFLCEPEATILLAVAVGEDNSSIQTLLFVQYTARLGEHSRVRTWGEHREEHTYVSFVSFLGNASHDA